MRLAMLIDRPGWCFDRTAQGLQKFHGTEHRWFSVCAIDHEGHSPAHVEPADLYRLGGLQLLPWFADRGLLPRNQLRCVPTVASFADVEEPLRQIEEKHLDIVAAVLINDIRQEEYVAHLGLPIFYSPDRVDPDVFHPIPELRPKSGPIRVGWAGSEVFWPGVKHVDLVAKACSSTRGCTFVRQDREKDGWKSAEEMCRWLNGLDLYITANDELTCTPVTLLEAVACGISVVTTRCGELWPLVEAEHPEWIIEKPTLSAIKDALKAAAARGRGHLHGAGCGLRRRHAKRWVTWECGEARRITRVLARLAEEVKARGL